VERRNGPRRLRDIDDDDDDDELMMSVAILKMMRYLTAAK